MMFHCKRAGVYPPKGHYVDADGVARQTEVTQIQARFIEQVKQLETAIHEAGVREFPLAAKVKWITGFEGVEAKPIFARGTVLSHGVSRQVTVSSSAGEKVSLRFEDLLPDSVQAGPGESTSPIATIKTVELGGRA